MGCLVIYYTTAGVQFRVILKKGDKTMRVEQHTTDGLGQPAWAQVVASGSDACALGVVCRCLLERPTPMLVDESHCSIEMGTLT